MRAQEKAAAVLRCLQVGITPKSNNTYAKGNRLTYGHKKGPT